MGSRRDAALSVLVLVAVGLAFVAVDAAVSLPAAVLGGLGTVAFELVASRSYETIRGYWERPVVQAVSVGLSLVGVAIGTLVAPSSVLSFAFGSLVTYLGYLVVTPCVR